MLSLLLLAFGTSEARAESVIDFKTSGPVSIFVDGQQATLTGNLRQRVGGLTAGVHQLEVSGMFGKKLYEAEIDLPDDTVTYVSWERGEIKVLKTEWLEDEAAAEAPASDEAIAVEEPAGEPPVDELAAAIPVEPPMLPVEAPVEPPPVPVEAPPVVAAAPVAPAVPVATPTEPVLAAPGIPVDAATALPMPKSKTLTVQAADGMRIEVVHNGHKMVVVVEGDTFKIQDANGMNLALSEE